jgi:hypothetical protein
MKVKSFTSWARLHGDQDVNMAGTKSWEPIDVNKEGWQQKPRLKGDVAPNRGDIKIPMMSWRLWGKQRKFQVAIARNLAEIRTVYVVQHYYVVEGIFVWRGGKVPTFRRYLLPLSSGWGHHFAPRHWYITKLLVVTSSLSVILIHSPSWCRTSRAVCLFSYVTRFAM